MPSARAPSALAALLGAAMTPPAPRPAASAVLAPTEQENYVARRVSDIVAREHYRRAPLDDRLSSLILDRYLDAIDGGRSYFYASDIAEFERYRYELDDAIKAGDVEPAFVIFRRFQQRSRERMNYAHRAACEEAGFRYRRILQLRSRKGTLAGERRRDERVVAQTRQERRAVADHRRQAVAGGRRYPAQALRARGEAHGSEQAGRCFRSVHECLRAVARSAFELLLGAQLRGIQHSDELELRGHRRLAAIDRRLCHRDRRDRGRPRRRQRQARRERSHHRGRRRQDRRAHRCDRLAPR